MNSYRITSQNIDSIMGACRTLGIAAVKDKGALLVLPTDMRQELRVLRICDAHGINDETAQIIKGCALCGKEDCPGPWHHCI